jgi:1-phosphofructokinase family hexose kinase
VILTVTPNPAWDKIYWVDRLSTEAETPLTRATRSASSAGGKGINISTFLARAGLETIAMGFIAGHTGRVIESRVREAGITTSFVWAEGETRTNLSLIEKGHEPRPLVITEAGPFVPETALQQFLRRYLRLIPRVRLVVFGGSLPPGVPPGFYQELIKIAHDHRIKTIVNAAGEPLLAALEERPFLVKPDTRERREICGEPVESDEQMIRTCQRLVAAGVGAVVISHHVTNDVLATAEGVWDLQAQEVRPVNLVSAEDILIAGMVLQLAQGRTLLEAAEFGMAAATASSESFEPIAADPASITEARAKIRRVKLM